jgi:hypothetical protein
MVHARRREETQIEDVSPRGRSAVQRSSVVGKRRVNETALGGEHNSMRIAAATEGYSGMVRPPLMFVTCDMSVKTEDSLRYCATNDQQNKRKKSKR